MRPRRRPVAQQQRPIRQRGHQQVHPSVVVEIERRRGASAQLGLENRPALRGRIFECPVAPVLQQEALPAHQVMRVAIRDEHVLVAVVVEVEEGATPSHELGRDRPQSRGHHVIGEDPLGRAEIEGSVAKPRHQQVGPPVPVGIAHRRPHRPRRLPQGVEGHPHFRPHLGKPPLPVVQEQQVGRKIVRQVEIHVPVQIQIPRSHRHRPMARDPDAGGFAHVLESPVAPVPVEHVELRLVRQRVRKSVRLKIQPVLRIERQIVRHEQIQPAVLIDVDEHRPDPGPGIPHLRPVGDVLERPVTPVPVQLVLPHTGHVQIRTPVVVVVARRGGGPVPRPRHPGPGRHVLEGPVAPVAVQPVRLPHHAGPRFRHPLQRTAVHQKDVHPPIPVEIQDRPARPVRFDDVGDMVVAQLVHEPEPRPAGHILEQIRRPRRNRRLHGPEARPLRRRARGRGRGRGRRGRRGGCRGGRRTRSGGSFAAGEAAEQQAEEQSDRSRAGWVIPVIVHARRTERRAPRGGRNTTNARISAAG